MIDVLEIPLYYGCNCQGVDLAPSLLTRQIHNEEKSFQIRKIIVPPILNEADEVSSMKHLNSILAADEQLACAVAQSKQAGHFPLVLGGDHALGIGSVAGASTGKDFGVIWIDAHGDCNTEKTSPSGNVHGMPLAASMGFGDKRLTQFFNEKSKVDPNHVLLIGIRSLDQGEIDLISKTKIEVIFAKDVLADLSGVIKKIQDWIVVQGLQDIHVSFDVDCMDPTVFPGTSTRVKNGLSQHEASCILQTILRTQLVHSLDFTEYNPLLDCNQKSLKVAQELLEDILKWIQ